MNTIGLNNGHAIELFFQRKNDVSKVVNICENFDDFGAFTAGSIGWKLLHVDAQGRHFIGMDSDFGYYAGISDSAETLFVTCAGECYPVVAIENSVEATNGILESSPDLALMLCDDNGRHYISPINSSSPAPVTDF